MVKTTVYLDDADAAGLRRLSACTGRSQAQLIRDAVAAIVASAEPRRFRSHGAGRGTGEPIARRASSILREELGSRRAR